MGKWLVSLSLVLSAGTCFAGRQRGGFPEVDPARTVELIGEVGGAATINLADRILTLAADDGAIYLVINSPGGSVTAGTFVLTALQVAKARGREIVCLVPGVAASMAFQIFSQCTQRFAFKTAFLLWHPVRQSGRGAFTPLEATQMATELTRVERTLVTDLRAQLELSDEVFYYHYYAETLFRADELLELVPDFYQLVDDAPGVSQLAPFRPGPFGFRDGELVWGMSAAAWARFQ